MTKETGALVQKLRLQRELVARAIGRTVRSQRPNDPTNRARADRQFEDVECSRLGVRIDFVTLKEPEVDKPNMPNVSNEEALAFAHVRRIKGFYLHLTQYLVVIGVLAMMNFMMSPRYIWVGWVALGWGSGVLIHGLRAFDKVPFLTADWEKRQAEKYLGRNL